MKKILKTLGWIVLAMVLAGVLFIGYLSITEYNPADIEPALLRAEGGEAIPKGEELTVLSWNVGFCALGKDADFAMDGGGKVPPADEEAVNSYMAGVEATLQEQNPDLIILQEVDQKSARTFRIDQRDSFTVGNDAFTLNYSCDFVPMKIPRMGMVNSGVFTTTGYEIESADRHSLPNPFSWPVRTANLKRCLLVSYLPVEGSDKKLVLVNFHLEAYDSGEGKIAQTRQLIEFVQQEYEKGNYVIAGGDWNQTFPGSLEVYPNTHEDLWAVGLVDAGMIPEGWTIACDNSVPTCRLLNQPYDPEDTENTQYYVIDGFICSPNVTVTGTRTLDLGFAYSDHNPVELSFVLGE